MKKKMTASQIQELIENNRINENPLSDEDYVDVQIPNWIIDILLLLFPNWSPAKSLEYICKEFIDENKQAKLN